MSLGRVVHPSRSGPLYGGLTWLPCPEGRPSRRTLQEAREPLSASHSVLVRSDHATFYGLATDDDDGIVRHGRSAAAQFVHRLQDPALDAALVLRLRQEGEGSARPEAAGVLYFATLVERGVPLAEVVGNEDRVRSLLAGFTGHVFTDTALFGEPQASWEWLDDPPTPAARLRRIPGNPWHLIAAVITLTVGTGGWVLWHLHKEQVGRDLAFAAAREADPAPRYLAALEQQRQRALSSRDQWRELLRSLMGLPWKVAGWQLQSIDCVPAEARCQATWLRRGGTYRELQAALPRHDWIWSIDQPLQLDLAVTSWRASIAPLPLAVSTPTYDQFGHEAGSVFQVWRTAALSVDTKVPTLWPAVPGVPTSFADPQALRRGEITVTHIPAPFVDEVIASAPATVSWNRLRIEVADAALASSAASARAVMVSLDGSFYVR